MTTAFLFPGQGSQFVGMGKDLYEANPAAKEVYDLADKLFTEFHNSELKSISEISFNGPEEELKRTVYTQPAIITLSLALANVLKQDIKAGKTEAPKFTAGHSLGEFAALFMADLLSLEDTLKLVIKRGALMENAPAGAMTAVVGLSEADLATVIDPIEGVSVANFNSPEQIVITGTAEGVKSANDTLEKHATENDLKVRVIPLVVGGAFHSPLMQAASEEFAQDIDNANFAETASIPVIQNFNGKQVSAKADIINNLKQQMTGAVQWTKTVQIVIDEADGATDALEIGPGKVIAGLVKKQNRRFKITSIQDQTGLEALTAAAV